MKYIPRNYQQYACNSVFQYFMSGKTGNPLVAMPTGTGKSFVIAMLLHMILTQWGNQRILVLTHVKELIEQNFEKLLDIWPQAPAGIYSASLNRRDTMHPIIFGGIASVIKQFASLGRFNLVFVDECHLVNPEEAGMYRKLFAALTELNPNLKIIGFTATPWKLGHGSIVEDGIFTDICCDMTSVEAFNWLIAQGYLMPLIPKKTKLLLDTDGVHMRGGEFIPSELQTAVDRDEITRAALIEAIEAGGDRVSWLIFASGVEHAVHISEMLNNEFGISSIAVHGKLGKTARNDAIGGWKAGKYRVAVNNNVMTTGVDNPMLDLILMLRPTASPVLWVQMLGRGTRPVYAGNYDLTTIEGRFAAIHEGGKVNCLVLDYAGNTKRLGPINDPLKPRKKGEGGGEAPVKECPCGIWCHASVRYCGGQPVMVDLGNGVSQYNPLFDRDRGCGHEFTFETKLMQAASTEVLVKGDTPVVEEFKVDHITCTLHKNQNGEMVKVVYYCGYKMFTEFVAPEHPQQGMRTKAGTWLKRRGGVPVETNTELMNAMNTLVQATHLRVWTNQKYPTILATCFDGTNFGAQEPATDRPTVETHNNVYPHYGRTKKPEADDDIPFTDEEMKRLQSVPDWRPKPAPNFSDMDDDIPF